MFFRPVLVCSRLYSSTGGTLTPQHRCESSQRWCSQLGQCLYKEKRHDCGMIDFLKIQTFLRCNKHVIILKYLRFALIICNADTLIFNKKSETNFQLVCQIAHLC